MGRSHSLRSSVVLGRSGPVWLHYQGYPFHVIALQSHRLLLVLRYINPSTSLSFSSPNSIGFTLSPLVILTGYGPSLKITCRPPSSHLSAWLWSSLCSCHSLCLFPPPSCLHSLIYFYPKTLILLPTFLHPFPPPYCHHCAWFLYPKTLILLYPFTLHLVLIIPWPCCYHHLIFLWPLHLI